MVLWILYKHLVKTWFTKYWHYDLQNTCTMWHTLKNVWTVSTQNTMKVFLENVRKLHSDSVYR